MIQPAEFRLGNFLMQKVNNRIITLPCSFEHFGLMSREAAKDLYPVVLKAEILEKCGFLENKDYPLSPEAREFRLVLPVNGQGEQELKAWIKSNKECFGRALVNGVPASNAFYFLHQLQNLFYALTGSELSVRLS